MGIFSIKIDISGQKFNKWTVIRPAKNRGKISYWVCKCSCGSTKEVNGSSLKRGISKSCGKCTNAIGMSGSSLYQLWAAMWTRVANPNHECYCRYGGRGISICDKWKTFKGFYEDMGDRPKGMTLDRKDNNGNYCKENCRWASRKEQANNTAWNKHIVFNGVAYTVAQLSESLGIKYTTLRRRIKTGGILNAPIKSGKKQTMRHL
jgi:hypothetical protein